METNNRQKILILSFTLVVVMLGFGMVIPIFPFFIEHLGAGGSELGLLVATSALLEFVFSPVWGGVSDRIGRKPVLMLGMVGYGLSSLLFGLSTKLWMLFASRRCQASSRRPRWRQPWPTSATPRRRRIEAAGWAS